MMTHSKGFIMALSKYLIMLFVAFISITSHGATVRYQHTDMLGSVVAESDASGNIISRSQYEPFGKRMGGDKEGIGYTGHLQDKDLGLTYMQARYYDPLIGRFYANDPMGFKDVHNFNRYAYGNNNPYKYVDPDGKAVEVVARPLDIPIIGGRGAHTYTRVTANDGTKTVISSHKVDGKNVISKNHSSDTSKHSDSGSTTIAPPEGMTEEQFDNAVLSQGEKMIAEKPLDYEAYPDSDSPGEGNCHTTTRNLINGAGGKIPDNYDPDGANPDLHGDRKTNGN